MNFAPEYFNGETRNGFYVQPLMKRIWAAQIEVLEEIERICNKYGLKYFAVYGTLLGAVRHKGFIPWDDDLDISMLREDYDKFSEIVEQELPDEWRIYDCRDDGFFTRLIRVVNARGSRLDAPFLEQFHGCPFAIGIDIIPWDHIPDDPADEKKMFDRIMLLDSTAVNWDNLSKNPGNAKLVLKNLEETTGCHFDRKKSLSSQILCQADRAAAMYSGQKTKFAAVAADLPERPEDRLPLSCFDKFIRLPFEGTTIPAIADYELMLEKYYGPDYMQPQIRYDTHSYPFFVNKLHTLQEFFAKENMAFPECFHAFVPKNGSPLVSIIIPCCSGGEHIDRCLQSLLCQTICAANIQIICIDSNISAEVSGKLEKWEQFLGNILTIISCDASIDAETAKAIGMEYAAADYVSFMEPDDWAEQDWLETLYRNIEAEAPDVAACPYQDDPSDTLHYFDRQADTKAGQFLVIDAIEKRKIFIKLHLLDSTSYGKLIKKELLIQNGICPPAQNDPDNACHLSLLCFFADKVYVQNEPLYHHYVGSYSAPHDPCPDACTGLWAFCPAEWLTWQERGFLKDYRAELEYIFLRYYYLAFLKRLPGEEAQSAYGLFKSAKEETLSFIPGYQQNRYYKEGFNEFQKILLETLTMPIDQAGFSQISGMISSSSQFI